MARKEVKPNTIKKSFEELPVAENEDEDSMEVDEFKKTSMSFIRHAIL